MYKAETRLQQVERHTCEANCRITRQEMPIPRLEPRGRTAALPYAGDLLAGMLPSLDASGAHHGALLLRRN